MELKEAVKVALQSLWANKLRSVLTLLGVVIGVASVIAVVTLVNGANTYVTTKFSSYGADVFTVSRMPQLITSSEDYERFQKRKNILFDDYKYVRDNCKLCLGLGAQQTSIGKVVRGTQSVTDSQIRGYTWQMPSLQNLNIEQGRGFTETDEDHASHVAIIGTDIQDHLFAGVDPLGQELRVDGESYTVVGVSEKQGSTFGASQDNWVGVPLPAYQKSYGTSKSVTIYIKAGAAGPVLENAADEVRVLMRARRHDAPGSPDDFELDTNNTLVGFFSTITKSFGAVAGAIALISLVVGGIVIMNIMLVSVTERTREIGVRKAIGARRSDIIVQFLTEAVVLTVMGGILGLALGWVISRIAGMIFPNLPTAVPLWTAVMGVMVSVGVGLFFGIWPASRAARLDPVEALRYE